MSVSRLRYVSAKVFGNEKVVEVVNALHAASDVATAKQIAVATGIDHSLVRDVLVKLHEAEIVKKLPRSNTRAAQYYEADQSSPVWETLRATTLAIAESVDAVSEGRQAARFSP